MSKYHVYALGNALVDMEYSVSDEFLASHGIEKGVMTLVDQAQQHQLIDQLSDHHCNMASGGSAANTIIAVSHFGGKAFYSCKVASDNTGDFYVKDLTAAGVDTNLGSQREDGISGKCIVMVTPDAERTMHSFLGISEQLTQDELRNEAIANSEYLYIEGYLVASDSSRQSAIAARQTAEQAGVKTALTFSDPNMVKFFGVGLGEMIGEQVDLLFCNREEAMMWADTDDLERACQALKKVAKSFAITLGADGALVFDGNQEHQIPGFPVKAVDTNGAGDLFAGAMLYGLTHGMDYVASATLASQAAAQLVTEFGPRLKPEQYQRILRSADLS